MSQRFAIGSQSGFKPPTATQSPSKIKPRVGKAGISGKGTLDFFKKRSMFELHHQERMAAIEKGIEVPPLPPEFFQDRNTGRRMARTPADHLFRGLRWLLLVSASLAVGMRPGWPLNMSCWVEPLAQNSR